MGFERFIAFRYLKSPRQEKSVSVITMISVIGVAIGVMALIVVLSVMNGFERDLKNALIGANSHLTLRQFSLGGKGMKYDDQLIAKIKKSADVKNITPFTMHQGLLMGNDKPVGTLVKGINPEIESDSEATRSMIRASQYSGKRTPEEIDAELSKAKETLLKLKARMVVRPNNRGEVRNVKVAGIILGSHLARNLGVGLNDYVTLISPEERISPLGGLPRAKKFVVAGFFESGIAGYDEVLSFIDLTEAQKIFRLKDHISAVSINLKNPDLVEEAQEKLEEQFPFPFMVRTWIQENKNLFAVIQLEKLGLGIILTLIILVAAFNIISSLIMLVMEKRKDVAILKSMGATNRSIRNIFILQGSVIGLLGTIIGEIGGLLLCYIIANFDIVDIPAGVYVGNRIPLYIEPWQITLIALISFVICFLVTIAPSYNASRIDPVEGLRYE